MADLLLDNFQDVIGTQLVDHYPDVNSYGQPWTEALSTQRAEIGADPDLVDNTLLEMRGGVLRSVFIRIGTSGEVECKATLRANNVGDSVIAALASRFVNSGGWIYSYYITLDLDNDLVDLTKKLDNSYTVLATSAISGSSDIYEDVFISAIGNTQFARVDSKNINLGPVTDSQVSGSYDYTSLWGTYDSTEPIFIRSIEVSLPTFDVTVSDIANGNDNAQLTGLYINIGDSGNIIDNISPQDIFVVATELAISIENTVLNENQFKINDVGFVVENVAMSGNLLNVIDNQVILDKLNIKVNTISTDNIIGSDLNIPNSPELILPDNGIAIDQIIGVTLEFIKITDNSEIGPERDFVKIFVKANDIFDQNTSEIESIRIQLLITLIESAFANTVFSINVVNVSTFDLAQGFDEQVINNILPVINDLLININEVLSVASALADNDNGFGNEIIESVTLLKMLDDGFIIDSPTITNIPKLFEFGAILELVLVNHFEIQSVNDLIIAFDQVTNIVDAFVINDVGLATEINNINQLLSIIQNSSGADKINVIGSLGKRINDQAFSLDNLKPISSHIPIIDLGAINELTKIDQDNTKVLDLGLFKDSVFRYDGKQQIIHVLFTLRRPRILFTLNIDKEHNQ